MDVDFGTGVRLNLPARGMYCSVVIALPLTVTPSSLELSFFTSLRMRLTDALVGIAVDLRARMLYVVVFGA